jgi:two-component system cell cycle response regulator DivK
MKPKVLIVDDDPDCMCILRHALTAAGYQAVPAYGGEDAIRKAKTEHPALVLTDLAMPKVNGIEVIYSIKHDPTTRHIPVLAVTAHIWDWIAKGANQAGCDGYVAKPFKLKDLIAAVRIHIERFAA